MENGKSNEQCRSHHQKMLQKFGSVENIIAIFKKSKFSLEKGDQDSIQKSQICQEIDTRLNSDTNNEKDLNLDRI